MKVRFYTQGKNIPSTRFRVIQYVDFFNKKKIETSIMDAHVSSYPPSNKWLRLSWGWRELINRSFQVITSFVSSAKISVFQREMISTMYTLERFISGIKVLDVDDAIWLRGSGVNKIAVNCDAIVCGNNFLKEYFIRFGKPVYVIPTAVDTSRFKNFCNKEKVIGWTGGSSAFSYLYDIEDALLEVLDRNLDWKLKIMADIAPEFSKIPKTRVEFCKWSPEIEASTISSFGIGIMPIANSEWCKGKCSYKMMLYMASEVPVVVSDIGMNTELLHEAQIGLGVQEVSEWSNHIQRLITDSKSRVEFGLNGRDLICKSYSLEASAVKWIQVFNDSTKSVNL